LGWELAIKQIFDFVLMDIHLPGMDGKELTKKLRMTSEYANKPIVALTASAMAHDIAAVEGLFDDYITKPVDISEFIAVLDKHLHRGR